MRVISGSARGRRLKEPAGGFIRPTSGKVKESIFNILQFDIEGRRVLDLFAGTGQLGIEALSRGAASAVFVDSRNDAARLVRENLGICGFSDRAMVYATDALRYLEYDEKFDIILIDPPYDSGLTEKVLKKVAQFDKINENGIIICETGGAIEEDVLAPPYALAKQYRYGKVIISRIGKL